MSKRFFLNVYSRRVAMYVLGGLVVGGLLGLQGLPALATSAEMDYDRLILVTAQQYGLEPALIKAVIRCESAFNARARSPRGAQGLMQLMPATRDWLGVSDAFDPEHNIDGGSRYLAMLKQQFEADLTLILAAYNAGPQAVVDAGNTIPPFAETQQYVRCAQSAYQHYRRYGLQQPFPGVLEARIQPQTLSRLVVNPLRFSSNVARLGERLLVYIEARNTSAYVSQGVVMLNYPDRLVSFMALHTSENQTTVQLAQSSAAPGTASSQLHNAYQLLWRQWPDWQPGERRTATIALVPRVPEDITLHLSVVLKTPTQIADQQRWSSVVRIPFHTTTW